MVSKSTRLLVRSRANNRCEYCQLRQEDSPLAFHPRQQQWNDHFRWEQIHVVGLTAVGRTTIIVLDINSAEQLELRMV